MNIYCLTSIFCFILKGTAYIDVKGEFKFDLYSLISNEGKNEKDNKMAINAKILRNKEGDGEETTPGLHDATIRQLGGTTKDDCVYQIPTRKQTEALLSDMMNQLTKIFLRANDYMSRQGARRNAKRFKIVRQKPDSSFFEQAYDFMRQEYRQSINATPDIFNLTGNEPCHHQSVLKEIWKNLLEQSKNILRRAAVRCVSDFLRVRNRADDTRAKEKIAQLLLRELKEVRSNQLKFLCDDFNLCYTDLLYSDDRHQNNTHIIVT